MSFETSLLRHYSDVRKRLTGAPPISEPAVIETERAIEPKRRPAAPLLSRRMTTRYAIYDVIEGSLKISRKQLLSGSRLKEIVYARRIACWLGSQFKIADGLKGIGRYMGVGDHSSVWYHLHVATNTRRSNSEYATLLDALAHQVTEIVEQREIER